MKKIILLICVLFFLCSCTKENQAKQTVESYIEKMAEGECLQANKMQKDVQEELSLDEMAQEAGYTGKIKSYFESYMKYLIGKQWESYEITKVSKGKNYYLVYVNVKGIAADDFENLDQSKVVESLQEELKNSQSEEEKEKAFKKYFKACKKEVDTLSTIERKVIFKVDESYQIESIDLE